MFYIVRLNSKIIAMFPNKANAQWFANFFKGDGKLEITLEFWCEMEENCFN